MLWPFTSYVHLYIKLIRGQYT